MKQSVERESVLDAMRAMYAAGILPTRRNWNANRPSGLPGDLTVVKMFGREQWANIVAMAVDVEIRCKTSWLLATEEKRRALAVELIREISTQLGHRPSVIEWDEERPLYVPGAQKVVRIFRCTWHELTMGLIADDIGEMKAFANGLRFRSSGIKVGPETKKRIRIGPNQYRTVYASLVI